MTVKLINDTLSFLQQALDASEGTKYQRLAGELARLIRDGHLEPEAKLPPHRILGNRLGITAGTVSRAYGELERQGLVTARVGDGTFVRQADREPQRDRGFRNAAETDGLFDMSRNQHIPGAEIAELAASLQALAVDPGRLLHLTAYSPEQGWPHHRAAGASWLSHGEFQPRADEVLCTNGGQHALLCALMALLRPGDTLATEQLTYPGLISVARSLGIRLMGVPMDVEGLLPEALDELCRHHRISALYCTPTLQNPTTAVMSATRRQAVAECCRRHNLLIIEDDAHGVLLAERPLPLAHHAAERSVLIGSLSKAVASGLRVGYLHAPQPLIGRLAAALRSSCWMATPLTQELACQWIDSGTAQHLLRQQVEEIARRKTLVTGALAGLGYRTHPRSPHFWIEVPEPWRAAEVAEELELRHYRVSTAEAFAVGRAAVPQFLRASVSNAEADDTRLLAGFAALAQALRAGSEVPPAD